MSSAAQPVPGPCYKFTVRSADEAATLIRERLGAQARVLSVRTVEAGGLARLWSAPRLEVIAQIDASLPVPAEAAPLPGAAPSPPAPSAFVPPPPLPVEPAPELPRVPHRAPRSLAALLRRTGLSELALGRLQSSPGWEGLQSLPLHRALAEAGARLRLEADRPAGRPLTRAAFLGAPGVGRTTALCKWLGMEVFRRGRLGHVVSVEFDRPNPPGPLPVFCEALGVPVARFPASTRPAVPGGFVYFDLPGLSTRDPGENKAIADFLAREQIEQRVLVLNAAYDHAALRTAYAAGRSLGATHLVFTHLDEVPQWGRLWDYLIDGALEPVFFATGPSLTGDCEEDVCSALVRRTLVPAAAGDEAEIETEAQASAAR
ncbi:MAG TPA: flagellar GTP-binding protein [Opitutaceae bacterium]|nr:flagellar GTP-binding protein [Opitutaceae bacterium]